MLLLIKVLSIASLLFFNVPSIFSQDQKVADSLEHIYRQGSLPDTAKLELLRNLSFNEGDTKLSLMYSQELIDLAGALENDLYVSRGYLQKGNKEILIGNLKEALAAYFKGADAAIKAKSPEDEGSLYGAIADVYSILHNHPNAMVYYNKAIVTLRPFGDSIRLASAILNAGDEYRTNKNYDSALLYFNEARTIFERINYKPGIAISAGNTAMVYANTGRIDIAEANFKKAITTLDSLGNYSPVCTYLLSLSDIYLQEKDEVAAINTALKSLALAEQYNFKEQIRDANLKLSQLYDGIHNQKQAFDYYRNYIIYRDSIDNLKTIKQLADLRTNFEVSKKQDEVDRIKRQKNLQKIILFAALAVLAVILALVIKLRSNYRQKQMAYTLLSKEKDISERQRDQTHNALEELKRTQAHLVHSEKMASLGQLTTGIAHEIQNPLNFVNNFSDMNTELITELQEENRKGNTEAVQKLAEDILSNAGKISYHGKRVDAIVKGMLEHTRSGAPERRLTNINALADEYFRLAYIGLRGKEKSFNAAMHTDFDPAAGEINIVPQEMGRVILNLVNNAFQAVAARIKEAPLNYSPVVTISTKKLDGQMQISVKDNGIGIPAALKEKIFQPFFTTKAPGDGTGLGLSITYDIVKAHSGEIVVISEVGAGSEFIVKLPLDKIDSWSYNTS